jgi:hypothetical protein
LNSEQWLALVVGYQVQVRSARVGAVAMRSRRFANAVQSLSWMMVSDHHPIIEYQRLIGEYQRLVGE